MSEVPQDSREDAEYREEIQRIIDENREVLDELA